MSSNPKNISNRKIGSQVNLLVTKSASETSKINSNLRSARNRTSSTNAFIKKRDEILQSYKAVLNKPCFGSLGDADLFFKQSLRNYEDCEPRFVNWDQKQSRSDKIFELNNDFDSLFKESAIHKQRKRRHYTREHKKKDSVKCEETQSTHLVKEGHPDNQLLPEETEVFVELLVNESDQILEDTEREEFFSPSSEHFEEAKPQDIKSTLYLTEEPQEPDKEEELKSVLESDTNYDMAEDQDISQAEDLVRTAGSQLSEIAAETESLQEAIDATASVEVTTDTLNTDLVSGVETVDVTSNTDGTERFVSESEDEGKVNDNPEKADEVGNSAIAYDPNIDNAVIKELEEAERQAMETANIIYELKQRVAQLLGKQRMTEQEGRELEEKNKQLRDQMCLFETKTKRIQYLIDQASFFENMIPPRPPFEGKHNEDVLPKVIICGATENNMPKIIVCDDKRKKSGSRGVYQVPSPPSVMPQFAKRLSESYYMQERLAAENADLEGKRYQLQEDLLDKDQTVESLQRKLNSLQGEMRMVCKENSLLADKLQRIETCPAPCSNRNTEVERFGNKGKRMPCGKNKGPCPADVESRLQEYSETTQQLEKQLNDMESEVRNMQNELVAVQKERQHLEQHRRMMCPPPPCGQPPCGSSPCGPPPCGPPPCGPSPCGAPPCGLPPCGPPPCGPPPCLPLPCGGPCAPPPCGMSPCPKPPCGGPCNPALRKGPSLDQQLRELREQYNRLQDDYKAKLTEVAGLRADTEKLKQTTKDAEEAKKIAEEKVKDCERELKNYKLEKSKFMGSKEQLLEQEQQLNVAKQRFREAQDELEELRALIQDQQAQLDDYRNKYLQAQQQVEEQRRQIDMMEMENNRISEQVNLEIQRVKNQFQEKLQELTPLPDMLKNTQMKLQEAQQMHLLAERNNEALVHEVQAYKDKAAAMADQIEKVRSDQQLGADEKASIAQRALDLEEKLNEALEDNDRIKTDLVRMEEIAEQNEKRAQEKLHEIAQLVGQLETVREESARQVARTKDRCETVRRSMQNQIADLERQLAQSRAQARSAQKDRDEIRQKMQAQINNLNENFEDAQMRIRNLQGHVNFLKSSYTNVFTGDGMGGDTMDPCDCGSTF